ncbi:long-chain acyl-CoA synthetase [Clostridium sp. DSM 8431]|uniref:AMP-binding protein n=1 Tax=Clostridium sp. DSM 8431 TaxID=1761781 RepID=UPI0008ECCF41|nr:AMP-binding protein [Clostridium sp. DSM 8431]SFU59823.1 long-chain acyl-CoA synthetase [Clostridium sp. DSM 8431]
MKNKNYPFYNTIDVYTVKDLLLANEEEFPNNIIIKYKKKSKIIDIDYIELNKQVNSLGTAFFMMGIKNCKVGILGNISYEWALSYLTLVCGGVTVVPIDKSLKKEEVSFILEETNCKAVIYDSTYIDTINDLKNMNLQVKYYIKMNELYKLSEEGKQLKELGREEYSKYKVHEDSIAQIIYTSGTSSKPRGIVLTHKNILSDGIAAAKIAFLGEVAYMNVDMHHVYSIILGIIVPMIQGTIVFFDSNSKNFMKNFNKVNLESMIVVPSTLIYLRKYIMNELKKVNSDFKLKMKIKLSLFLMSHGINISNRLFAKVKDILGLDIKYIFCENASIDEDLVKEFRALGIEVLNAYGLSETSGIISINRNKFNNPGSVGQVIPGCEVTVSEEGEIMVKGPMVMKEYYKDEEKTKSAFKREWFKTGDIGYIDREGFLHIVGRIKNIITLKNGQTVSPEEIEYKLRRIDGIKEASILYVEGEIHAEIYLDLEYMKINNIENHDKYIREKIKDFNKNNADFKKIRRLDIKKEEFKAKEDNKLNRFKMIKY